MRATARAFFRLWREGGLEGPDDPRLLRFLSQLRLTRDDLPVLRFLATGLRRHRGLVEPRPDLPLTPPPPYSSSFYSRLLPNSQRSPPHSHSQPNLRDPLPHGAAQPQSQAPANSIPRSRSSTLTMPIVK
jgi:hypothetical protein